MNLARPQTRQVREHGQAKSRHQLRLFRVREQSASAFSPRQQPRKQSVHIRGNDAASTGHNSATATGIDIPQPDCIRELATAAVQPQTGLGREPDLARNCLMHWIDLDILPPISFPVCLHHNAAYDLL